MINAHFISCISAGALGGALFQLLWLLKIGQSVDSIPSRDAVNQKHRLSMFALSIMAGITAGFLVYVWNLNELRTGAAELTKVTVLAAIAGLSGESVLGFLRKMASV